MLTHLVHLTSKNTVFVVNTAEMLLVLEANCIYFILVLVFVSQHVADVVMQSGSWQHLEKGLLELLTSGR